MLDTGVMIAVAACLVAIVLVVARMVW